MSKHELRSRETKHKIYQTARLLLEEREFNNITVQEICQHANVSIVSFYHHFPFKEALLTEIYRRGDSYFSKIVVNRIPSGDAITRLCMFIKLWMHFIMTSVGVTNIKYPDKQWSLFHQQMISLDKITTQTLTDIIQAGIKNNEINSYQDSTQIIEFIKSYMWGFSYRWCFQKGHIESKPNFKALTETLISMLKPFPSSSPIKNEGLVSQYNRTSTK